MKFGILVLLCCIIVLFGFVNMTDNDIQDKVDNIGNEMPTEKNMDTNENSDVIEPIDGEKQKIAVNSVLEQRMKKMMDSEKYMKSIENNKAKEDELD